MRHALLALAALAAPLALTACKGSEPAAPAKPAVKWPAKPANGAPIALVFKKFEGEGDRKVALFDLFNFGESNLTRFTAMLEYLDASGKVLKDFPHTHMKVVGGKEVAEIKAGFFIPAEATSVRAVIRNTEHGAANKWTAPEGGDAPPAAAASVPGSAAASAPASAPDSAAASAPGSAAASAPASAPDSAAASAPASAPASGAGEGEGEAEGDAEEAAEGAAE
jgi:hypothetical protein